MDTTSDYVVGVDFGTLSGRAVVVGVADGHERGRGVHDYEHPAVSDRLFAEYVTIHDYFGRDSIEVTRRRKALRREVRR